MSRNDFFKSNARFELIEIDGEVDSILRTAFSLIDIFGIKEV